MAFFIGWCDVGGGLWWLWGIEGLIVGGWVLFGLAWGVFGRMLEVMMETLKAISASQEPPQGRGR
jgi:hypothetical protein